MMYHSPDGQEVDPVEWLHDAWVNNHMPTIWHNVLGYFILSNAMNAFEDLNDQARYPRVPIAEADLGIVMRSDFVTDVLVTDVFKDGFWHDQEYAGYLLDPTMYDAIRYALNKGLLIEGSLRLLVTPMLKHGAERLELKLVWLEKVVPEVKE